jgi:hypothetical protein
VKESAPKILVDAEAEAVVALEEATEAEVKARKAEVDHVAATLVEEEASIGMRTVKTLHGMKSTITPIVLGTTRVILHWKQKFQL